VAVSLWVDYYDEGETPKGTALLEETSDHLDRRYACLRDGCFSARFRFSRDAGEGLSFSATGSGAGSLAYELRAANASDIQRYYFCVEDCEVQGAPSAAPTASGAPTPGPSALPSRPRGV